MATGKLALYNVALRACGERPLDSLTEDRDPRRALDEVWSSGNGAVRYCLEQGFWHFALRSIELDSESGIEPAFGFEYAFAKPTDFVRLTMISGDENFHEPLSRYEPEGGYIYADTDPIWLQYVSDDGSFGGDYAKWPESFTQFVGHWLASQIAPRLKNDLDLDRLEARVKFLLKDAQAKDAQIRPTRFPPMGNWARARFGRVGSGRRDRGPRGTLLS